MDLEEQICELKQVSTDAQVQFRDQLEAKTAQVEALVSIIEDAERAARLGKTRLETCEIESPDVDYRYVGLLNSIEEAGMTWDKAGVLRALDAEATATALAWQDEPDEQGRWWFQGRISDEHEPMFEIVNLVEGRDYSQVTLGLNWKPNKHVVLRPEVRWDWSGVNVPGAFPAGTGMFDDFSDKTQFTFGLDMILRR